MELNVSTIRAIVQVLEESLPQEIKARNEAGPVELDAPVQILDYMPIPATYGGGLPIVAVQDLPGRFENDLQHSMEGTYGLGIAALIQTADHQTLAWQLREYVAAIASVIQADRMKGTESVMRKPPANVLYTRFADTEPGPLLGNRNPENSGAPPDSYRSWTWLVLECRRQEVGG